MQIGVLCSGGDAPGMNAAVLGTTDTSEAEIVFIKNGYRGIYERTFAFPNAIEIETSQAGAAIGTARFDEFRQPKTRAEIAKILHEEGFDALVVAGGNGSWEGARLLKAETGFPVIVVPATIDNDFPNTDYTLGFDSALDCISNAVDDLILTARSHHRVFLLEVMGRKSFELAESAAYANFSIPVLDESKDNLDRIAENVNKQGRSQILIVPEGLPDKQDAIEYLSEKIELETKYLNLSYLQRGAKPTTYDRLIGHRFGAEAISYLLANQDGYLGRKDGKIMLSNW